MTAVDIGTKAPAGAQRKADAVKLALETQLAELELLLGSLPELETTAKDNLVVAINEIKQLLATHLADMASQEIGKGASLVGVHDADSLFSATTVEDALKEAITKANSAFTSASNGKTDIATVTGLPATANDTFPQLKTHIQNAKNKGAANLTAKGVPASGTDTLNSIMTKIGQISTGKKSAEGTQVKASNAPFQISGLSFMPRMVIYYLTTPQGYHTRFLSTAVRDGDILFLSGQNVSELISRFYNNSVYVQSYTPTFTPDGFTSGFAGSMEMTVKWFAYE